MSHYDRLTLLIKNNKGKNKQIEYSKIGGESKRIFIHAYEWWQEFGL
ncbi:hypothetical protein EMIT07CA2_10699 [Brevibacillus sp. IT-7CA2]